MMEKMKTIIVCILYHVQVRFLASVFSSAPFYPAGPRVTEVKKMFGPEIRKGMKGATNRS